VSKKATEMPLARKSIVFWFSFQVGNALEKPGVYLPYLNTYISHTAFTNTSLGVPFPCLGMLLIIYPDNSEIGAI